MSAVAAHHRWNNNGASSLPRAFLSQKKGDVETALPILFFSLPLPEVSTCFSPKMTVNAI